MKNLENQKVVTITSLKGQKVTKSYTRKERFEYLKEISSTLSDEIFKKAEVIFPNEIAIITELLKIELNYRFNSNQESSL